MPRGNGKRNPGGTRSILAVSDLAPASDVVLRASARIARHTGADLHVVHAMGLHGASIREALVLLDESHVRQTRRELEAQLARALPGHMRPASYGLDYQSAYRAVRHRAREVRANLVVIGPREPRMPGLRPPDLSLPEAAAHGGAPVLVVRPPVPWPARRIVVPVDRSGLISGALRRAGGWLGRVLETEAAAPGARSVFLKVVYLARQLDEWRELAPLLDAEVRRLEETGGEAGVRVRRSIRWGAPASEQALCVARADRADLILLGTFGQPYGDAGPSGETVRHILRGAPCSVLVLPDGAADPSVETTGGADHAPHPAPPGSGSRHEPATEDEGVLVEAAAD